MYRYQEPPPPPKPRNSTNTLALISLIAGVLGALTSALSLCIWYFGGIPLILGIVAAVMGFLAKKQNDESGRQQSSRKMATAGMIPGFGEHSFINCVYCAGHHLQRIQRT